MPPTPAPTARSRLGPCGIPESPPARAGFRRFRWPIMKAFVFEGGVPGPFDHFLGGIGS